MANRRVILWFRQDLRMHDNESLTEAVSSGCDIIPVYVFDKRTFAGKTKYGFEKTGVHRRKFIIECIQDLRKSLEAMGSQLIVRIGKPEEVLFELAHQYKTNWVYCNRERTTEEKFVQDTLEKNLWSIGQEIRYARGKMLYYTADLPFPITHTPDSYTTFKKEVEKIVPIRQPLTVPAFLGGFPKIEIDKGIIPDTLDFGDPENLETAKKIHSDTSNKTESLDDTFCVCSAFYIRLYSIKSIQIYSSHF
jgi:deoxyribodipyrimidine photo-lyase